MQKAAQKRNVQLISWYPHKVQLYCKDKKCYPLYDGKKIQPDIILHRTIYPFTGVVLPSLQLWSNIGTIVLNNPIYASRSRDKLLTIIDLCNAGIPFVPSIGFVKSGDNDLSLLDAEQVIIKPAHGLRGEGIQLLSSSKQFVIPTDVSNSLLPLEHYLAQPFINTDGRDIRAFVVNGKCIAIMQRQAKKGEFRANLTQGANGKALSINHPASKRAVAAIQACRLDYGGVDMIEDINGTIRILEVDAWAGFAGITKISGQDIAGAIIDMAINVYQKGKR
jgi:ribosomal protein S6--L-glutamate ligase